MTSSHTIRVILAEFFLFSQIDCTVVVQCYHSFHAAVAAAVGQLTTFVAFESRTCEKLITKNNQNTKHHTYLFLLVLHFRTLKRNLL